MIKFEVGDLFAHRYRLLNALGSGATGSTFLATDESTEIPKRDGAVALKLLHSNDQEMWRRFENEARALQEINSEFIPRLKEFGKDDSSGVLFLAQEYVPGNTLEHLLSLGVHIDAEGAKSALRSLLDALETLHKAKIIHRDVKPGNIILDAEKNYKLVDLGSSLVSCIGQELTQSFTGTIGYAPLEQLCGHADPSTDLYSLGRVIISTLIGLNPNDFCPPKASSHQWQSLCSVDAAFAGILEKMIDLEPALRFSSVQAVRDALAAGSPTENATSMYTADVSAAPLVQGHHSAVTHGAARVFRETSPNGISPFAPLIELAKPYDSVALAHKGIVAYREAARELFWISLQDTNSRKIHSGTKVEFEAPTCDRTLPTSLSLLLDCNAYLLNSDLELEQIVPWEISRDRESAVFRGSHLFLVADREGVIWKSDHAFRGRGARFDISHDSIPLRYQLCESPGEALFDYIEEGSLMSGRICYGTLLNYVFKKKARFQFSSNQDLSKVVLRRCDHWLAVGLGSELLLFHEDSRIPKWTWQFDGIISTIALQADTHFVQAAVGTSNGTYFQSNTSLAQRITQSAGVKSVFLHESISYSKHKYWVLVEHNQAGEVRAFYAKKDQFLL